MIIMRLLSCFCLGSIASLSLPPFGFLFVLPISFSPFIYILLNAKTRGLRFWYGWFFGFGYFVFSLSWIGNALMVEADKFAWMKPVALIAIPAFLAVYIGCVSFISSILPNRKMLSCWIFAITWTLAEVIRSYLIFPFPWNLLGYAVYSSDQLSQFASIIGVYGLSFISVLFSSILVTRSLKWMLFSGLCVIIIYSYGNFRLSGKELYEGEKMTARIIHSGQLTHHLGNKDKVIQQINDLIKLSNKEHSKAPELIIWPEAIVPLETSSNIASILSYNLPKGSWLVSGADRIGYGFDGQKYYNSMVSINANGHVDSIYDKHILVPFGEYIPMRSVFPSIIQKVAYGMGDFSPGEGGDLLDVNQVKALPLICYEAIFSFYLNKFQLSDVVFIINITNDSWFGDSIGPKQHFYMSKFRAIEYGIPMLRVANGGISALIDEYGVDIVKIDDKKGVVEDVNILNIKHAPTFYREYLCVLEFIFLVASVLTCIFAMRILYRSKDEN